jgi:Bacterial Ig domain
VNRRLAATLCLLLAGIALSSGALPSGADFVASSVNPASTFATAASFNTVAVTTTDPGTPLAGTVTLEATASSFYPLTSVRIQRSPAGAGSWTDVCTDTQAPYSCSWATTSVSSGLYDLRSIALDANGYTRTSATVASRRVDNTAPTASLTNPGTTLSGTRTISASGTDTGGSGVAGVLIEYRTSSSGSWTAICTDSTAPYSCAWNTTAVADGLYDLRSTTTDNAGNSRTSTVLTSRRVDNTAPTVSLSDDGALRRGTTVFAATASDGGSGVATVEFEYRAAGSGTWAAICSDSSSPYTCSADTRGVADGLYEIRAIATDGGSNATTSETITVRIDNTSPIAAMTDPGTPLSGTVSLDGTASDAVGLASMRFEYKLSSGSTWTTACTGSAPPSPFSCSFDTTTVADGTYDLRAVATDTAGNSGASTPITSRVVDNGGPVTILADPGTHLRQTTTLTATASDVSGVQSVAFQYAPAGSGTWTTICTDTTSAYSCAWDTTTVADGRYDLRTVAVDTLGRESSSAELTGRTVDNTSPAAVDVQVTQIGTADRIDQDSVVFTYSQAMLPASILAGWSGASTAISVRVIDNGTADSMDFYDAANTTRLNLTASATGLRLNADHVGSTGAVFNADIVYSGVVVMVNITSVRTGAIRTGDKPEVALGWTPSTAATSLTGVACLPIAVTESGAADEDF